MVQLFSDGGPYHTETSPLIWRANQWTGFYMIRTPVMEELKINTWLWPPLNCESRQILGNNLPQKQPPEVFCKKRVLKNFANFPGKHLQSLFNKVTGLKACISIKKRLQHRCFFAKFAKFSKTPILKNMCERLLLLL